MLEKFRPSPGSQEIKKSKQERESLKRESRREFLKKLGLGAIILGLGGMEAVLSSGCSANRIGLKSEEVHKGLESFYRKLEDPNGHLKYLEDREFIIKNEIFDAYAQTVDKRPKWLGSPIGGYMSQSYLDRKEEVEEFREKLAELGLSRNEAEFYESLFASSDIIIFRESILKKRLFLKALPHERFHKAIAWLNDGEYRIMTEAAQEIMKSKDDRGVCLVAERYYENKVSFGFYTAAASMDWEEFYTYLAQGEFDDSVERALKDGYPKAYGIFSRIKEARKLKEQK